jgi:3-hydroxy-D-aspartate aldolase
MTDEDSALIGQPGSRWRLSTPVLVLDLDALDRNIERMAAFAAAHSMALRPHVKTHKTPEIGWRQRAAGAIGLCCAKLGEAEVMAAAGLDDGLHITAPIVAAPTLARLAALHARTRGLSCVVDHPLGVAALAQALAGAARPLDVLIDIDPGLHRTGVTSPAAAVALWQAIEATPALRYRGVQFYCGAQQHIPGYAERSAAMADRADILRTVLAALAEAGAPAGVVTGGGTGTHRIDVTLNLFTELQVGSYVVMDQEYAACDLTEGETPFEVALSVQSGVISANTPGMVTLDAGIKAFATDGGTPFVLSGAPTSATYRFMGDEQGALILGEASLPLGSVVSLGVSHCDPTINLYDTYHVVRGDTLIALWPVAARGRSR